MEAGLCLAGLRRPDLGEPWSWAGKFVFFLRARGVFAAFRAGGGMV